MTTDPAQDRGAFASEPGSREPSPKGLGPSGFDPSRKENAVNDEDTASLATMGNLFGAIAAAAGELSRVPDMTEATRLADCEAFAMRERMAARSAEYFAKKDRERAR